MRGRAQDADQTGPPGGDGGEVLPGPQHSVQAGGGGSVSQIFIHSLSAREVSFHFIMDIFGRHLDVLKTHFESSEGKIR